jgi:hypothetical protein
LARRFTLTVYLQPTVQWYRPMLEKWQAIEDNYGIIRKLQLTREEIKDILDWRFTSKWAG